MDVRKRIHISILIITACLLIAQYPAFSQVLSKAQVGEKIKRVEDLTDEFKEYLERKADDTRSRASSPQAQEGRRRRSESAGEPTEAQKAQVQSGKDDIEGSVEDLEKATDRLNRRFKRAQNYLDTKAQVEKVVEEGRKINQLVVRGNYSSEVAKAWAALRTAINDLARIYGVTPMSV